FLFLGACQSNTTALMMNANSDTVPGNLAICSNLSFKNDTFPKGLSSIQTQGFELALTISGSFEGASGWANLSNNFDGEGLSMGLLSQNLGQ
ncbi:hypothetical protein, partial [Enterococcus casseliflavus]|uniref:hypothetical protein n=1 Tax=Enterococcus casseliflavus TaxID=37734 RepID=UPI003D12743C